MAAEHKHSNTAAVGDGAVGQGSRERRIVRDVIARMRLNPVRNITIITMVVAAIVGLGLGMRWLVPEADEPQAAPGATLSAALQALDAGDDNRARGIAARLRVFGPLAPDEQGGPAYVLGMIITHDAQRAEMEGERRIQNLLAARYLEEALSAGLPPGREGDGMFALGRAYHDCGLYAQSVPMLQAALDTNPAQRTAIHGLLMNAYLYTKPPQFALAMQHCREFLADDAVEPEARNDALMEQAEIQFRLGEVANCEATLSSLPETSEHHPRVLLMQGRLLLQQGDQLAAPLLATATDHVDQQLALPILEKYAAARDLLGRALELAARNHRLARQAQYLLGLGYRKAAPLRATSQERMIDLRAAAEQFAQARRVYADTAEGISAGLEEAEIQLALGEDDAAVKSFQRLLRFAADMQPYNNPWVSAQELQTRVEAAYTTLCEQEKFEYAVTLAGMMTPMFAKARAVELQAAAQESAAVHRISAAEIVKPAEAQLLIQEGRSDHRAAAAFYAELARLRFSTRQYPEDLWKAADNYLRGQDYDRAARHLRRYLNSQDHQARPPALTALGEALLALNQPEEALPWLTECIDFFPRDPHSFRARIIAAQAHRELDNTVQAKLLLQANLEHEALTPRSLEWRESLYALGELLYQDGMHFEVQSRLQGANADAATEPDRHRAGLKQLELAQVAFHDAIRKLTEAVQRDPTAPQAIESRYMIAESRRQAAKLPRRKLPAVTIDTTRKSLTSEIQAELTMAESGYRELIELLDTRREQSELSDLERRILRNCYFARADVLYDMERYDDAIQAYSDATGRFQHEPESLEAYVQIANCHRRRNRPAEARGTVEQAKVVLNRIRPDADFTRTTRYNRNEWNQLLNWLGNL